MIQYFCIIFLSVVVQCKCDAQVDYNVPFYPTLRVDRQMEDNLQENEVIPLGQQETKIQQDEIKEAIPEGQQEIGSEPAIDKKTIPVSEQATESQLNFGKNSLDLIFELLIHLFNSLRSFLRAWARLAKVPESSISDFLPNLFKAFMELLRNVVEAIEAANSVKFLNAYAAFYKIVAHLWISFYTSFQVIFTISSEDLASLFLSNVGLITEMVLTFAKDVVAISSS